MTSDFVNNPIKSDDFKNENEKFHKETQFQRKVEEPISSFNFRQLEQKIRESFQKPLSLERILDVVKIF